MKKFNNVILAGIQEGISDLHITGGQPFCFRKNGTIGFNHNIQWTPQEIDDMLRPMLNARQLKILRDRHSLDFAMTIRHIRLRINVFNTSMGLSLAVRLLPGIVPTLTMLNLHPSLQQICQEKTGLVLICGTTGCGKSTTIAAIIDEINRIRAAHIITLEDPIEYRFSASKSLIQQRELGTHFPSFMQGLQDVLREDPDVIVVGELRDPETIRLTLHAAESGHLVIATLHATKGEDAVYRMCNSFPPGAQDEIRFQIASSMAWTIVQQLVYLHRAKIRVPLLSIIKGTQSVKGLIRDNKLFQIENAAHMGKTEGMFTMERYLNEYLNLRDVFANPHQIFMPSEESVPETAYISSLIEPQLQGKAVSAYSLPPFAGQEEEAQKYLELLKATPGMFASSELDSPVHVIPGDVSLDDLITQIGKTERGPQDKTNK
jgi:twitching motility protein PilT